MALSPSVNIDAVRSLLRILVPEMAKTPPVTRNPRSVELLVERTVADRHRRVGRLHPPKLVLGEIQSAQARRLPG